MLLVAAMIVAVVAAGWGARAFLGEEAPREDGRGTVAGQDQLEAGAWAKVERVLRDPIPRVGPAYLYWDILAKPLSKAEAEAIGRTVTKMVPSNKRVFLQLITRVFYEEDAWAGGQEGAGPAVIIWTEREAKGGSITVGVDGFVPGEGDQRRMFEAFRQEALMGPWKASELDEKRGWVEVMIGKEKDGIRVDSYAEAVFAIVHRVGCPTRDDAVLDRVPGIQGIKARMFNSKGQIVAKVEGNRRAWRALEHTYLRRYDEYVKLSKESDAIKQRRNAGVLTKGQYEAGMDRIAEARHGWYLGVWVAAVPYFRQSWFSDELSREIPANWYRY